MQSIFRTVHFVYRKMNSLNFKSIWIKIYHDIKNQLTLNLF